MVEVFLPKGGECGIKTPDPLSSEGFASLIRYPQWFA